MIYHITHLKDVLGNYYLGIKFENTELQPYLNKLKEILSESEFKIYTESQKKRDSGQYHLTLINVADYNSLSQKLGVDKFVSSLDKLFDTEINDLQMLGVGMAQNNENTAYFVVCRSPLLQSIREFYGLREHDFHITLGFKWKDVFGVRKNQVLENKSKFIEVLKTHFLEKENFNFLRKISNFDESTELEIIPISLTDSYLKVSCGEYIMDVGLLEDQMKLFIFTKYKKSQEVKRLPQTEIIKILFKN